MDTCTQMATSLLKQYEEKYKCCDDGEITISHKVDDCAINPLKKYNELTCAILYSSGYWCMVTKNKKISTGRKIDFWIKKMTAEQQARLHNLGMD